MKIDTKKVLVSLKGEPLISDETELTLGIALANVLSLAKEGGKMKLYILAQKLYDGTLKDIDQSDLILLKQAVETNSGYNNLVLGQLAVILEELRDDKKE